MQSKPIPESRGLFVVLLIADMLNTLLQNIILSAKGERRASAIAAFSVFGIIAVVFFGSLAIVHFLYLCFLRGHRINFITSVVQTVGALFFFYGNNINDLVENYGSAVGCDSTSTCGANSRILSSFALGIALIIFNIVPSVTKGVLKLLKLKRKPTSLIANKIPDWFAAIDMITMFVKINTLYSAIVSMVQSTEFCNNTEIATSTTFLLVCIILGFFAEVVYFMNARVTNKDNSKLYTGLVSFTFAAMLLCLPLYLLADNRQPLNCAFGCDTFASDLTLNDLSCNTIANEAVRIGFTALALIFIGTIPIIFFFLNRKARDEFTEIGSAFKEKIEMPEVGGVIKETITDLGETVKDKMETIGDTVQETVEINY